MYLLDLTLREIKKICTEQKECTHCPLDPFCDLNFREAPADWEKEEDPATYEFEPGRVYWDEMAANP